MTDRHAGYMIALRDDIREDDAEALIAALRQFSAIVDVVPVTADPMAAIVGVRRDSAWIDALVETIDRVRRAP